MLLLIFLNHLSKIYKIFLLIFCYIELIKISSNYLIFCLIEISILEVFSKQYLYRKSTSIIIVIKIIQNTCLLKMIVDY